MARNFVGIEFGPWRVVRETAPETQPGKHRTFLVACSTCGAAKSMRYTDVQRALGVKRPQRCKSCDARGAAAPVEDIPSYEYREPMGLLRQDFIYGRMPWRDTSMCPNDVT